MTSPIRVVLVDDQDLVRAGFRMVIDATPDMTVVAEASDGPAAVEALALIPADVVVMDLRGDDRGVAEATRRISAGPHSPRIVVLTTFDSARDVVTALEAGATAFVLKDAGASEVLQAIRAVHRGDEVVAPRTLGRLLERIVPGPSAPDDAAGARLAVLTDREREVLEAVGHGLSNGEIAHDLDLAEATVKTHIGRILAKLHLRDRVQMVVVAYECGLVRPGAV